jgi:molybdopterin synthase sulfur carrier subunit
MATVTVLWFAHLREQRGCEQESVATAAASLGALYDELAARHGIALPRRSVLPAVDEAFARWEAPLREGSTIAFLPPVSGG